MAVECSGLWAPAGACYSPLCSGGKEKLSLGWSADAPFSCSVFLTVGRIHPATLGIGSLPASSLFVRVARIHARATREKRFSFSMIEELARRLGYWIFFFFCIGRSSTVEMLSSCSATLSAKGLSSGTVQGITFPRTVRKFSSASYSRVIMFSICMTVKFI